MSAFNGLPILHLTIDNMRHSMVQALTDHHEEIERICDEQMKEFLAANEIEKIVRAEFKRVSQATIVDSLKDAVHKAIWSGDVKQILQATVHDALLKVLREYYPGSEPEKT